MFDTETALEIRQNAAAFSVECAVYNVIEGALETLGVAQHALRELAAGRIDGHETRDPSEVVTFADRIRDAHFSACMLALAGSRRFLRYATLATRSWGQYGESLTAQRAHERARDAAFSALCRADLLK